MKYIKVYLITVSMIAVMFTACSDLQDNITPPQTQVSVVHGSGFITKGSSNFHGNLLKSTNWDLKQCQECHAKDYSGGPTKVTCNTPSCHSSVKGPEACNTCHGDFNDPSKIAPPRALDGSTAETSPGVGAHSTHLFEDVLSKRIACKECHVIPTDVFDPGHIDNTPGAEITFGDFAKTGGLNPTFDASTLKCNNTYCHGNFEFLKANSTLSEGLKNFIYTSDKITGNNFSPVWNKVDETQDACGTCHGLPPTGHRSFALNQCADCHTGVVNDKGEIIDNTRHMNGQIDVYEQN